MRNACILLQNKPYEIDDGAKSVIDTFDALGYSFDGLYSLSFSAEEDARETVQSLQQKAENITLITTKAALTSVKRWLEERLLLLPKTEFSGAGIYETGSCNLFLLSGDCSETGVLYAKNACAPYLEKKYGVSYQRTVVRAVGANLARVEGVLAEIKTQGGDKIRALHTRKFDEDRIELIYDSAASKILVDGLLKLLLIGLGDTVYALNDVSLEEQLVNMLKLRRGKISVAESFTGGGVARRITSVAGASEVYFEGINAYNADAKRKRLGVTEYTLRSMGAVSDQTAYEMALGLLNTGNCDVSIATTGIAGPQSDSSMQPVGLCYVAVGLKEKIYVYRYKLDGTRNEITEKAINYALFQTYKHLKSV